MAEPARDAGGLLPPRRRVGTAREVAPRDPHEALALLREARSLWRGPALDEFVDVAPLAAWARTLAELHL